MPGCPHATAEVVVEEVEAAEVEVAEVEVEVEAAEVGVEVEEAVEEAVEVEVEVEVEAEVEVEVEEVAVEEAVEESRRRMAATNLRRALPRCCRRRCCLPRPGCRLTSQRLRSDCGECASRAGSRRGWARRAR